MYSSSVGLGASGCGGHERGPGACLAASGFVAWLLYLQHPELKQSDQYDAGTVTWSAGHAACPVMQSTDALN